MRYDAASTEGRNAMLYDALRKERTGDVVALCRQRDMYPDGPFHVLTIHRDTVLHMAAYTVQPELVNKLLRLLVPTEIQNLIFRRNYVGNTILHEAAAFNKLVRAAQQMLEMAPDLLPIRNVSGETALFRAARFGKLDMFLYLDGRVKHRSDLSEEARKEMYHNDYDTTVLHTAVMSGHFRLALKIAASYDYLVDQKDENGMTALQHLARHSTAFQGRNPGCLKRLIYQCVPEEHDNPIGHEDKDARGWRVPLWEKIREEKLTYHFAKQVAKFLVKKDMESWKKTEVLVEVSFKRKVQEEFWDEEGVSEAEDYETPLFLATKAGCVDIVEEILELYPQAVEHIDRNGCTILHIAIKYRQIEVFDMVERMGTLIKKLIQKTDNELNSILHMVGEKTEYMIEQMKGKPENLESDLVRAKDDKEDHRLKETNQNLVLQLQEDLLLFERVKKLCSQHFYNNVNSKGKTAEQVFYLKTEKLHTEAKDWLKRTSENSSLVAVLIATVAFAAAYTVPGGSNGTTGVPILLNKPLFVIFTITDVLSLTCTLTSLVIFLSILTSTFRLRDFKHSLPQKLMLGFTFLLLSVSMMMLSFAATVALMIRNKEQWTKIALYTVAFLPVTVFVFSYLPLYLSSMKSFKYILDKIGPAFPRYTGFIQKSKTKILTFIGLSKTEVPPQPYYLV